MKRICTACGKTKPEADYYRHGDGYRGKCKECFKASTRGQTAARNRALARLARKHSTEFKRLIAEEACHIDGVQ